MTIKLWQKDGQWGWTVYRGTLAMESADYLCKTKDDALMDAQEWIEDQRDD